MTSWAKAADYLIAYKYANASEWRRHLAWLEERGYPYLSQLRKELGAKANKSAGATLALSGSRDIPEEAGTPSDAELEGEVSEMGFDLLAGGA